MLEDDSPRYSAVSNRQKAGDEDRMRYRGGGQYYVKSEEEMKGLFWRMGGRRIPGEDLQTVVMCGDSWRIEAAEILMPEGYDS